jgi:urease accessory protein
MSGTAGILRPARLHCNEGIVLIRATTIERNAERQAGRIVDTVTLDYEDRRRRRIVLTGERGTTFLLDLAHATTLKDGDGLVLDDGAVVRVVGKPEGLVEVTAATASDLARLAWHIGNRHTDVQVVGERLRIRRDHVLEDMLRGLGAVLTPLEAPFDPESGAYRQGQSHGHHHSDDQDRGHDA